MPLTAPLSRRMPRSSMRGPPPGVTLLSPSQLEGELWTGEPNLAIHGCFTVCYVNVFNYIALYHIVSLQ